MTKRLPFFASCDALPMPQAQAADALHAFDDSRREISFSTFARRTDWQPSARKIGYAVGREDGLKLRNDYHVRFYSGRFDGRRAYVMIWSAYHLIFTAPRTENTPCPAP